MGEMDSLDALDPHNSITSHPGHGIDVSAFTGKSVGICFVPPLIIKRKTSVCVQCVNNLPVFIWKVCIHNIPLFFHHGYELYIEHVKV